ncbi:hypothetical protein RO3G_08209 [Lichtheimia corymbifera JMRC:FSU:9682]|uniref:Arrestin C-terminal-like domain-containing protein n=1 Tax=Lichtheimia corymbifera JMRC:FSU:9682 TaxID=1263082 RepID=A0A068RRJ0_9FUNG|nr:hypothetical protein RO3G_08209 [Lichtheimia corymbifera JMRC:FSU:9682]
MSLSPDQINISIHLLPEFGWTIDGEPVYGPGSAFQGYVRVELPEQPLKEKIDRLRVLFHASEAIALTKPKDDGSKYKRQQFFGTQRILWRCKTGGYEDSHGRVQDFPFTIQMPLVQFPPSMLIKNVYCCKFRLEAFLETRDDKLLAAAECPLSYTPLIETRTTKLTQPYVIAKTWPGPSSSGSGNNNIGPIIRIELESLTFVAGDCITPRIVFPTECSYQIALLRSTISTRDTNKTHMITTIVAEATDEELVIPSDLIPSVSYGRLMTIQYSLCIKVYSREPNITQQKNTGLLSRLLKSSPATVTFDDIPIQIGTLGYGIRGPSDLAPYTEFKDVFDRSSDSSLPPLPVPEFVSTTEYNDCLPVYESYHLPSYEEDILSQKTVDSCTSLS